MRHDKYRKQPEPEPEPNEWTEELEDGRDARRRMHVGVTGVVDHAVAHVTYVQGMCVADVGVVEAAVDDACHW